MIKARFSSNGWVLAELFLVFIVMWFLCDSCLLYTSEKEVLAAEYQVQELDFSMFPKTLAETKRTLDDAQVPSLRKAILNYINNQIGAHVPEGTQIAGISDLSHFKVEGEIADTYGDSVARCV